MINPRDVVPESIMPGYPWLADTLIDASDIRKKMTVLRTLGAPYSDEEIENSMEELKGKSELGAMISYLQRLAQSSKPGGDGWLHFTVSGLWHCWCYLWQLSFGHDMANGRMSSQKPQDCL